MFKKEITSFVRTRNYPSFCPKAVFFDMDGVLFDSMKFHSRAWVEAMSEAGFTFSSEEAYMNEGQTGFATINKVFLRDKKRESTREEREAIYKRKAAFFESYGAIQKMPYAQALLEKIKNEGLQLFVVTGSAQPALINSVYDNFPDIFEQNHVITALDVKNGKPDPEPYLKALEKSGVKHWEAVIVENAPLGVQAGFSSGIFTIGVNTGPLDKQTLIEAGANLLFDSMCDLYRQWDDFIASKTDNFF
ncbi:MAG: HAD-IA family hydrolase [Prevotellaceae bacterium]|jgi:HAD superfamily hydrolase (TIGR01509 family)|nr:HAD-IA family hydrolase [Prevotellaceae bacterium]